MAPFKLKFRMGSSRSTSQEVDSDPQVNQSLLGNNNNNYCNNNLEIGASNSTIDSVDCHSLISIENNDKKLLLPNTAIEKLGYTNPIITHNTDSTSLDENSPPSYEYIIGENHLRNLDLGSRLTISTEIASSSESDGINSGDLVIIDDETTNTNKKKFKSFNNIGGGGGSNCSNEFSSLTSNIILPTILNETKVSSSSTSSSSTSNQSRDIKTNFIQSYHNNSITGTSAVINNNTTKILELSSSIPAAAATATTTITNNQLLCGGNNIDGNRKESIDSTEYLISTMTATSPSSQENLLLNSNDDECTGSCEPFFRRSLSTSSSTTVPTASTAAGALPIASSTKTTINSQVHEQIYEQHQLHQQYEQQNDELDDNIIGSEIDTCDDIHSHQYCTGPNDQECPSYIAEMNEIEEINRRNAQNNLNNSGSYVQNNYYGDADDDDNWDTNQQHNQQLQHEQLQHFISNKSSKKIYKAVAKQWGITCKMSDQCRCMDCQSKYFDCEYDQNEHHKTDGGLGAGTPMFISEVMHGSACTIL